MRNLLFLLAIAGCAGDAPSNTGGGADAGVDASGEEIGFAVSGKTLDYFVAATPLMSATVTTDGIASMKMALSGIDGSYVLEAIPTGSKLFLSVSRPNYRPTRNHVVAVEDADVTQDLFVLSIADVNRQYATDGKPVTAGRAFFAADLVDGTGQPLVGVPKANIVLTDMNDQPVPGVIGPYFFGAQGDINPALEASEANAGKSRVAFLDAPAGTFKVTLTYPDGQGGNATSTAQLTAAPDGAVLASLGGAIAGAAAADPTFAANVYPRLQKAANGGVGCANCHTANGAGAILVLDAGAQTTLANLLARPGVIDAVTPANSLLLTKPLYEPTPPQNHPNATFLDINDADYKLILKWITNGAKP